jgi:antitoxin component of MazEF toxin-antitoxin module
VQNHRVYKNGNSYVMTLSAWQLNHIGVLPGQYVQVESKPSKRLVVTKAPKRIQAPIPAP